MTTDAERVIAAGVPVAIGDEELRLLFDFEALEIIEGEFGGLQPFVAALNQDWSGPRMKVCRVALRAGLAHLEDPRVNGPQAIRRLTAQLIGPGGVARANELAAAIVKAWEQAIPPAAPKSAGKASSRASGSHGDTSSTSPAKSSSKALASSGA